MNDPLISIVVPAYNYGRYLRECIGGVVNQTYGNWELLVVDNGSTDNTAEVLAQFDDPRIRKFRIEENRGPVQAWKLGYEESRGDYFAILPADDVFLPRKLERQVEFLREHPDVGAVGTYIQEIDEDSQVRAEGSWMVRDINQQIDFTDLRHWRWKHYLCIPTAIYSQELCHRAEAVPSDGMTNMCDWDFHVRLLGVGTKMAVIPEVLTSYRWHGSNTSLQRGDYFLQWTYSHARTYIPILRSIAPDAKREITACIEQNLLTCGPCFFVENIPENQLCAMVEALLDPEGNLANFANYHQFRAHAEGWMPDSENRAALAAVVRCLLDLRARLNSVPPLESDLSKLFHLQQAWLDMVNQLAAEKNSTSLLRKQLHDAHCVLLHGENSQEAWLQGPDSLVWTFKHMLCVIARRLRGLARRLTGSRAD